MTRTSAPPPAPLPAPHLIELHQLTKKFGHRTAVDALTLRVQPGEIYGLLGHNGAGKSTAIGMMLGQVWPTSGRVLLCGHEVTTRRHLALQRVGAIFETPVFYDYLSGWRNLEILTSYSAPVNETRLRQTLDWVGLTGREHSKVRTYSHGMRARLALAQALLPDPAMLILDEPSDGLDPEGIHEMRQTIQRLRQELGLTILFSSHLLHEVEQLCSKIAVLNHGRLVFEGTLLQAQSLTSTGWIRIQVAHFPQAVRFLQREAHIQAATEDGRIQLAAGRTPEQVLRHLVLEGFAVDAFTPEKPTLEDFYLQLMRDKP